MSTDKSAESIKNLTESDKIQSTASNEMTPSVTIKSVGLEQDDNKKEDLKMKIDTTTPESSTTGSTRMTIPESASDFNQWLQSMLAVARLPGGLPIEFRRKLWLALAERYLKRKGVDWEIEKVKWLGDKWRADDEELGIQIVKDLHRTGHSLLSGASGQLYQAKLKKILIGYTRWNPEVGYCQGFNMLGAIILQVMDKCEVDSIKVMIFLIEGLLPNGYFCGGLIGLQADMAVFRELLGYKLPKLARHLQKLQSSTNEPSFEPPIINVFTMQWFLTLFCNCLPMSYVLRIWDLIMIEGSDILLRTALSIWKVLEDRILREIKTADDFYCKMGSLSADLLNGSLIDANRLIHMISTLGPINDLQQLRQKHLKASLNDQKKLKMLYSNAENDESRMAVANAWAGRRGSLKSAPQSAQPRGQTDREKIALDITILKKQYDKLRERQKQAHIILSSAVTKQQQHQTSAGPSHVNKLLVGKNAIVSKGRKGPPKGAIPPVRNQKVAKSSKAPQKQSKPETLHWNNTDEGKKRRNSMTWKEINADRRIEEVKTMSKSSSASSLGSSSKPDMTSPKRRSDSSSYSEDSDCESSPSTSLCDDDVTSSLEVSPMKKKRHKDVPSDLPKPTLNIIEENSPVSSDTQDCPAISVSCSDNKTASPISNFYLDLPTNFGDGDITSISQLSPMPDLSSYFTAISPIRTPCDFFEFPDLSSFIMNTDEKYQVNEDGVTNEFFERHQITTPDNNKIMSKSFSPSILTTCDEGSETIAENENEIRDLSKFIKQKSQSMDEQSCEKEEFISINRSYSDGTIMNVDMKNDGFQKIIAENSKILNKLIPRTIDSPENVIESKFAKLSIDAAIPEEPKTPNNLSDLEEEIAAIDKAEDSDEIKEGILLSDIQDLANIESYLEKKSRSSDASLTCNTYKKYENVTERNEKSINDENETVEETFACNPLENKSVAEENCEIKALAVRDIQPTIEPRKAEEKSESPKFNEIQLMVTKLKEEMESQLKSSEVEVEEIEKVVEKKEEKASEMTVENADDVKKAAGGSSEVKIIEKKVQVTIVVESVEDPKNPPEKSEEKPKPTPEVSKACGETQSFEKKEIPKEVDGKRTGDLEKTANETPQKIDKNSSDMIPHNKQNTQLETCQKIPTRENLDSEHENRITANRNAVNSKVDYEERQIELANLKVQLEAEEKEASENANKETKKNSNEILEKLNMQLQRCEETGLKKSVKEASTSYVVPTKDRSIYDLARDTSVPSAVMELATLIKERELEKLSEQKLKASKEIDYELSLSPLRSSRSKSNISSPVESGKFNNFFYDHEPRNDVRRRDIITLETDQRIRRPFKSSPTSSLSSSPSNISNTLSSIQNTIKILDSACQKTDLVNNISKYDKALEQVEKYCESDKDWQSYKKNRYDTSPSFKIDDIRFDSHPPPKRQTYSDDEKLFEKSYDLSPRRKRYDFDIDDSNYKDVSPSKLKSRTPEIDPDYVAKLRYLSTEEYIAGRKSPLGGSRETLNTPKFKMDRSPTSPVISTHFSRSPRSPRSPSHSSSLLRFPSDNRSSKSAENSPSRYSSERVESSYKSPGGSIDFKAESMTNLSYKPAKRVEYEWEKPSSSRKYDFY